MTYSLHTLSSSAAPDDAPKGGGFLSEVGLLVGLLVLVFWWLAMLSYSPQDAAWSTSGSGIALRNWGGRVGALLADGSYFLFGFSAWWVLLVGVRAWLGGLATWLRVPQQPAGGTPILRAARWLP